MLQVGKGEGDCVHLRKLPPELIGPRHFSEPEEKIKGKKHL